MANWLFRLAALAIVTNWGCTNASLAAARVKLGAGQYAAARPDLLQAQRDLGQLPARQQREVLDDLCLTDSKIGAPAYSLAEQYRACAEAVKAPGSASGPRLATIAERERAATAAEVAAAIHATDFVRAENAVIRYQALPQADQRTITQWSRQIWALVNRDEAVALKRQAHTAAPAIHEITRQYPRVQAMDNSAFRNWILARTTVDGIRLVSHLRLDRGTLSLWIPDRTLHAVTLNLNRFAQVNDGLIARCRCDGRTNIALRNSGLPAYLVRLDAETHQSEVLILPQP